MTSRVTVLLGLLFCASTLAEAQRPSRPEMGFNVVGRSFVAILVHDATEAAEWYGAVLGLEEVNSIEADNGTYSIRILTDSRLTVELIQRRGAGPRHAESPLGFFKAGFFVDDIEAALAWLRGWGADTDQSIFIDEALNARSFVFRDPYGNRLQLFESCEEGCGR